MTLHNESLNGSSTRARASLQILLLSRSKRFLFGRPSCPASARVVGHLIGRRSATCPHLKGGKKRAQNHRKRRRKRHQQGRHLPARRRECRREALSLILMIGKYWPGLHGWQNECHGQPFNLKTR